METPLSALVDTLAIAQDLIQYANDTHTSLITLRNTIYNAVSGIPSELIELIKAANYAIITAVTTHEEIIASHVAANIIAQIMAELDEDEEMIEYMPKEYLEHNLKVIKQANTDLTIKKSSATNAVKSASDASYRVAILFTNFHQILIEHDLIDDEITTELHTVDANITAFLALNCVLETYWK